MDSHPCCVLTSSGILLGAVDATVGVRLASDQPLTHTFAPLTEKEELSLGPESPYLFTSRLRSPSLISSSSDSSSAREEVVQQESRVAAFRVNIDRAYASIERANLNIEQVYGRKVICIRTKLFQAC
jgi:hypothetical protein